VVLDRVQLLDPVLELGRSLLDAGISVGRLSLDLGHVLAFGVTLWISFLVARLLAFVLDREVLPRLELARGVPYALTSLARYTVLFVGFLFALAAAGFDVDRIAFLAGGLGVGIGFGLQNVVNNFISGLILLFERPVQVGDSVQLPAQGLFGRIRAIGIRASVIRTWDGAEVIVPNGDLISGVVTNWTLSDRNRRMDIPVEVARGTDPQRVVDLLVDVAAAHANVVDDPAPVCLFLGFGDSSLKFELRLWVGDFDLGLSTRSEVAIAVNEALRREGIEVPIPRLDVQTRERPASAGGPSPSTRNGEPS
jgi:small-conductance mechanosensitive channel